MIEDLHWAEQTLLELLSYILDDGDEAPLALVCTARPELADDAPGFLGTEGRRRTIDLQTLGPRGRSRPARPISPATPRSPRRRSPRR